MSERRAREIETPHGTARVHVSRGRAGAARGSLVLGHGAGGGVEAPDVQRAARAAEALGFDVTLVEQPYRVAGRRAPAPARRLDESWLTVVEALRESEGLGSPLVFGGRSLGARVACRTAARGGADAVLCLAFPLHPPGKGDDPSKSRLGELDAVEVPLLVVQGERDPFGMPPPAPGREVAVVAGDHGLKADLDAVEAAVGRWLGERAVAGAGG